MIKDKIKYRLVKIAAMLVKKAADPTALFRTGTKLYNTSNNVNKIGNGSADLATASAAVNIGKDMMDTAGRVPTGVTRIAGGLAAPVLGYNTYKRGKQTMDDISNGDYINAAHNGLNTVTNGIGTIGGLEALATGATTLSGPALLGAGVFSTAKGLTDMGMENYGTPAIEENLKGQENGKGATDWTKAYNSALNEANNSINSDSGAYYNPLRRAQMVGLNFINGLTSSNPYVGSNGEIIVPNYSTAAGQTVQQMGRAGGAIVTGVGKEVYDDFAGKRYDDAIRDTRVRNAQYQEEQAASGRESEIAQNNFRAEQWGKERLKQQQSEAAYNQTKAQQAANRGKVPTPLTAADSTRLQEMDYVPNQITNAPAPTITVPSEYMQEPGLPPERFAESSGQPVREDLARRAPRPGAPNSNTPVFPASFGKQFEGQPITYETLAKIYTDIFRNNNPTVAQRKIAELKQFARQNGFGDGKKIGEIARAQSAPSAPAQNQLANAPGGYRRAY